MSRRCLSVLAAALVAACATPAPEPMHLSDPALARTPEREFHDWTVLNYWRGLVLACPLPEAVRLDVESMAMTVNATAPLRLLDVHRFDATVPVAQARVREAMARDPQARCAAIGPELTAAFPAWEKAMSASAQQKARAFDALFPPRKPGAVSPPAAPPPANR